MARRRSLAGRAFRIVTGTAAVAFACLSYTWITLPDVRLLRTGNPTTTAFMDLRAREAADAGERLKKAHRWIPYSRIAPTLKRAVLVAEDAAFWDHDGVDFEELRASFEVYMERGGVLRGASTLTQQLAKNLYLSPSRNPYRKVIELMITRRLEAELPKARIFEIYLNVVEWGDGIWGADAAARAYFARSAADLSAEQAALLAGALINPRVYSPARPNARLLRRQQIVLRRMGRMSPPTAPANRAAAPVPGLPVTPPDDTEDLSRDAEPQVFPLAPPPPPTTP